MMKLNKPNPLLSRIVPLLLAAVLCLPLVACTTGNSKKPVTSETPATTEAPTTEPETPTTKAPLTTKPIPGTTEAPTTDADPEPVVPVPAVTFVAQSAAGVEQTFANQLPENFKTGTTIKFDCNDYDKDQSSDVQSFTELGITHRYTNPSASTAKLVFVINAAQAGIYDLCVDMRMKDGNHRYNLFSVNGEDAITMDFEIPEDKVETVRDDTHSSFMTGYQVQLNEGPNTIVITNPTGIDSLKTMHWRNLYLVRVSGLPVSYVIASTAGVDQTFSNLLPKAFQTQSTVKFECREYDKEASNSVSEFEEQGIKHYYTEAAKSDAKIVFKINVAAAGVYDLCIDMRMKNGDHRYNLVSVNGGEAFLIDFAMPTDKVEEVRDATYSSFMTGYQLQLNAGENTIVITNPTGIDGLKTMHWRNLYLAKVEAG